MDGIDGISPSRLARLAGGLYLVNILGGFFAIAVVPGITGSDIRGHELVFREGLAAHIVVTATNVPLAVIFYELFKVVDRRAALLVAFFTLVATAVEVAGVVGQFASLSQAGSVDTSGYSYYASTVFFGGYCVAMGYLVFRSSFMPRLIGAFMAIDGLAYLTNSFSSILAPDFAAHLVPYILLPSLLGEGSLCLWLLIAGVNVRRWNEQATRRPALAAAPGS